jgi:hypothetical protein
MTNTYTIGNLSNNTVTLTSSASSGSGYTIGTGTTTVPITHTTSGQIYTTTGTNGASWVNPTDNVMIVKNNPAELEVKGKMVLNGIDLEERLKTIEKVLQIPERDVKLESKHPKLKKMYDDYIKALAKYRTWDAIKGEE